MSLTPKPNSSAFSPSLLRKCLYYTPLQKSWSLTQNCLTAILTHTFSNKPPPPLAYKVFPNLCVYTCWKNLLFLTDFLRGTVLCRAPMLCNQNWNHEITHMLSLDCYFNVTISCFNRYFPSFSAFIFHSWFLTPSLCITACFGTRILGKTCTITTELCHIHELAIMLTEKYVHEVTRKQGHVLQRQLKWVCGSLCDHVLDSVLCNHFCCVFKVVLITVHHCQFHRLVPTQVSNICTHW